MHADRGIQTFLRTLTFHIDTAVYIHAHYVVITACLYH